MMASLTPCLLISTSDLSVYCCLLNVFSHQVGDFSFDFLICSLNTLDIIL